MTSGSSTPGAPRITWLGHSTVVLDLGGARLLTDPLLRRHNWPLRRRGPQPSRPLWDAPDLVLVSHLHHDHAELGSLRLVRSAPVFTAAENATWLRRRGLSGIGPDAGQDWLKVPDAQPDAQPGTQPEARSRAEVEVRLVRADHGHRPMPHRPNAANGHLVRGAGRAVYLAGDTSLYDQMAELPELAGGPIDLAVVPVGGWGPKLSGGHMDAEQAARACALIGARAALPVHWGTLHAPVVGHFPRGWMDIAGERFTQALKREAPECTPVVLSPGETVPLPG